MTRYKLKALRNTTVHESAIQHAVHNKLKQKKRKRFVQIPVVTAIVTGLLIIFVLMLIQPENNRSYSSQSSALLNVFYEIDGENVAYSENFKELDMQHIRQLRYYNEVPLEDFLQANHVTFPAVPAPFQRETGTVIAVNDGYFTELQFHFKAGDQFLNISMAPSVVDPINEEVLQNNLVDAAGNPIQLEQLNETTTLVKQKIQNGGGLVYKHYFYDEKREAINVIVTSANEFYSYANELIYHIGYNNTVSVDEQQMTEFVKDFILNNEIQALNLNQITFEENWLNRGGKTMLICLLISVISFILLKYLLKNASSKVKKVTWSFVWGIVHTPILSWLVSFSTGILYKDGFAVIGMLLISFPALFVIGLCIILPRNRTFLLQLIILHLIVYGFAFGSSFFMELHR